MLWCLVVCTKDKFNDIPGQEINTNLYLFALPAIEFFATNLKRSTLSLAMANAGALWLGFDVFTTT
jgi:hypothetical protein